jgi:hypothetical protein
MKTTIISRLATVIFTIMLTHLAYGQVVQPNIKLNTNNYLEVSCDIAGKSLAVVEDSVYSVWHAIAADSTYNIYFAKSVNGGTSFQSELMVNPHSITSAHVFPSIAVDNTGNIYIAWTALTNSGNDWNIWLAISTDGGNSFSSPKVLTTLNGCVYPAIAVDNNYIYVFYGDLSSYPAANYYFTRSIDYGQNFSAPIQINDSPSLEEINYSNLTSIAVDSAGIVHLAWVDGRRLNAKGDIFYAKSINNGQNFGINKMVNDSTQTASDSIQYYPSIAIGSTNKVLIGFIDYRLNKQSPRLYLATSSNGGNTFATETLFAAHSENTNYFDLAASSNGKVVAALVTSNLSDYGIWMFESINDGVTFSSPIALSDTMNMLSKDVKIVMDEQQQIYASWIDDRDSIWHVYFTKTSVGTSVLKHNSEIQARLFPNPSNAAFNIDFAEEQEEIRLSITNMQGQLVFEKNYTNTNLIQLDIPLRTGVYFIQLVADNKTSTLKLIKE